MFTTPFRVPSRTLPAPALTGMEMGLDIMGNSENIGSNIIFSSTLLWHSEKATRREKKLASGGWADVPGSGASKTPKPEHQQYTRNREHKKYCLLGNSVIHIIPFHTFSSFPRRLGSAGSKLFSESGGCGLRRRDCCCTFFIATSFSIQRERNGWYLVPSASADVVVTGKDLDTWREFLLVCVQSLDADDN